MRSWRVIAAVSLALNLVALGAVGAAVVSDGVAASLARPLGIATRGEVEEARLRAEVAEDNVRLREDDLGYVNDQVIGLTAEVAALRESVEKATDGRLVEDLEARVTDAQLRLARAEERLAGACEWARREARGGGAELAAALGAFHGRVC